MKLQRLALVGAAFVGIAALSGALVRAGSGEKRGELVVDGGKRTYAVHVRKIYDSKQAVPLVLALREAWEGSRPGKAYAFR